MASSSSASVGTGRCSFMHGVRVVGALIRRAALRIIGNPPITLPADGPTCTCSSTFARRRLIAANLYLRRGPLEVASVPAIGLALSFIGVVVLSISGYLGGTMVYDDGISVGRHRRRTATPTNTCRASAADEVASEGEQVFIAVANASQCKKAKPCAPILMGRRHNCESRWQTLRISGVLHLVMGRFRRCLERTEIECPGTAPVLMFARARSSGPGESRFENYRCESGGRKNQRRRFAPLARCMTCLLGIARVAWASLSPHLQQDPNDPNAASRNKLLSMNAHFPG